MTFVASGCDKSNAHFSHITPSVLLSKGLFVAAHLLIFLDLHIPTYTCTHTVLYFPSSSHFLQHLGGKKGSEHHVYSSRSHHLSNLYPEEGHFFTFPSKEETGK